MHSGVPVYEQMLRDFKLQNGTPNIKRLRHTVSPLGSSAAAPVTVDAPALSVTFGSTMERFPAIATTRFHMAEARCIAQLTGCSH